MCRILSISGKIEKDEMELLLKDFQRLAEYGNTPKGSGKGHKDGWGIVAYRKRKPVLFVRNYKNNSGNNKKYSVHHGITPRL
jgi:predicted glutamine amidotransferase